MPFRAFPDLPDPKKTSKLSKNPSGSRLTFNSQTNSGISVTGQWTNRWNHQVGWLFHEVNSHSLTSEYIYLSTLLMVYVLYLNISSLFSCLLYQTAFLKEYFLFHCIYLTVVEFLIHTKNLIKGQNRFVQFFVWLELLSLGLCYAGISAVVDEVWGYI